MCKQLIFGVNEFPHNGVSVHQGLLPRSDQVIDLVRIFAHFFAFLAFHELRK